MRLSEKTRQDLAQQLTRKAVAARIGEIVARANRMNVLFWENHIKAVAAKLKNPPEEWSELIAAGIVTAVVRETPDTEEGSLVCVKEVPASVLAVVASFPEVFLNFYISRDRGRISLTFHHGFSLPRTDGMARVTDKKLLEEASKLKAELVETFAAVEAFYEDVLAILRSCKTVKQLEEVLPEAAALLPKPVKNVTELAPVELRKAVQDRLKSGIPPKESRHD